MPKLKLFVLNIGFFLAIALILISPIQAQSPTFAPFPTGQPTCDLCGWCNKDINLTPPPDWNRCHTCLYDASNREATGSYYTVLGCLSTSPNKFVKSLMTVIFGIAGGIAFLSVLAGTGMILTSSGDPERLKSGKDLVTSSIAGLLLIVFSVFLLKVVGFDILRIPGFG
jgi:hypothetical protein